MSSLDEQKTALLNRIQRLQREKAELEQMIQNIDNQISDINRQLVSINIQREYENHPNYRD